MSEQKLIGKWATLNDHNCFYMEPDGLFEAISAEPTSKYIINYFGRYRICDNKLGIMYTHLKDVGGSCAIVELSNQIEQFYKFEFCDCADDADATNNFILKKCDAKNIAISLAQNNQFAPYMILLPE